MWACIFCESLNPDELDTCYVCRKAKQVAPPPAPPPPPPPPPPPKPKPPRYTICQHCGTRSDYNEVRSCTLCRTPLLPPGLIACPYCHSRMDTKLPACPNCGKKLKRWQCRECANMVPAGLDYCISCGAKIHAGVSDKTDRNLIILAIVSAVILLISVAAAVFSVNFSSSSRTSAEIIYETGGDVYDLPEMWTASDPKDGLSVQQMPDSI